MLATTAAKKAFIAKSAGTTAVRSLSVLSSPPSGISSTGSAIATSSGRNQHQLQQQRTLLGFVNAIDKRVYQWAKRQMPPISKTEQIALGCGTIGKQQLMDCICFVLADAAFRPVDVCFVMSAISLLRLFAFICTHIQPSSWRSSSSTNETISEKIILCDRL